MPRRWAALLAATALISAGAPLVAGPSNAVEVPNGDFTNTFSIQTNGVNAAITLGDYYSAAGGGAQSHAVVLNVPCSWPAATPIFLDLFSPQINTATVGYPGSQTYEEPNGAGDTTTFTLTGPGSTSVTNTYNPISSTTDTYDRFATLAAPVACGTYSLVTTTSDNDQNGWKLRFGTDNDGNPNNAPPANYDNPDGLAGTDDELSVGVARISYQHDLGDGAPAVAKCLTLYEYVAPNLPSVTFNNFDMDSASLTGSGVRYYAPSDAYDPLGQTGGTVGTISANGTWNKVGGGGTLTRSGDTIATPEAGWWKIVTCINNHNQFIQEGQLAAPSYLVQPGTPSLSVTKDDGVTVVDPGQTVTYTITLTNNATGATAGAATNVVATDTLPAGMTPVSCTITGATAGESCAYAGQVATATFAGKIPANGGTRSYTVVAKVASASPPSSFVSPVSAAYADSIGNAFPPVTASDTDTLTSADLAITKTHTGSFTVGVNGSYTLGVTNSAGSSTRARGVKISDTLPAGLTFVSGAGVGWSCTAVLQVVTCAYAPDLAPGASTAVVVTVAVGTAAFGTVTNTATVSSSTRDPVAANNSASDPTTVLGGSVGDVVFADTNGNGIQDGGEPGVAGVTVRLLDSALATLATTTTGASGSYAFPGLAPGTYSVQFVLPSGKVFSPLDAGVDDTVDSDANRTTGTTAPFALAAGVSNPTVDAGLVAAATIGDTVFDDPDTSGTQTAGELGLAGVTLTLSQGATTLGTTVTDANGHYAFAGLDAGTYRVTVTPTGGRTATTPAAQTLTVVAGQTDLSADFGLRAADRPPVAVDDTASVVSGGTVTTPLLGNDTDPDNDPLTVQSVTQPTHGTVTCDNTVSVGHPAPTCTYTSTAGFTGTDTYTYVVTDGRGLTDTGLVTVTVTAAPNQAPVFDPTTNNTSQTVPVGGTPGPLTASDPNGDPLTFTVTGGTLPPGVALNPNGTFSGATTTVGGPTTVTVTVTDGHSGTTTTDLQITVTGPAPGSPPVAVNDTATTPTNTPVTTSVLTNDSDPDNNPLTVVGHSTPTHGTVTCTSTTCTYTPAQGFTGTDGYTYTISDGTGNTATATVAVTVQNAPPTYTGTTGNTTQTVPRGAAPVPVTATDANGDPLTYAVTAGTLPPGVTLNPNGTFSGTTTTPGTTTVTVTVSDGRTGTATTVLTVTVPVSNAAPTAVPDSATTPEDTPVTVLVTANDTDPDADPLTVTAHTAPTHGTATCTGADCTYTPAKNFVGVDTFTYTVSDGHGHPATTTVTVTVTPVNDPPVAVRDRATTPSGTPVAIRVTTNDTDPESDPLTLTTSTQPAHGSVTCTAGGVCTYTPADGFSGNDSFTYTISDGHSGTSTARVDVVVTNQPPTAVPDSIAVLSATPATVPVLENDTDPEGDRLLIVQTTDPAHGTVTCSSRSCSYTSDAGYSGPDTFDYLINDGHGHTARTTVSVTVTLPDTTGTGEVPGTVVGSDGPGSVLPSTGSSVGAQAKYGFGLLGVGLLLLLAGRRRRRTV